MMELQRSKCRDGQSRRNGFRIRRAAGGGGDSNQWAGGSEAIVVVDQANGRSEAEDDEELTDASWGRTKLYAGTKNEAGELTVAMEE
jgi:hypothetical protein